jgi:PAS domain S-box-containing protein
MRMALHPLCGQERSDTSTMRRSAASPYLVLCAVAIVAVVTLWSVPRTVAYDMASALAVVAVLVGVRRNRPARRAAWLLLAFGAAAWVTGNVIGSVAELEGSHAPFGGAPGVFYVAGYPLFASGLIALGRGVPRSRSVRILLDTMVVVLTVGLVLWVPAFDVVLDRHRGGHLEHALAFVYPVADLVLVAAALRIVLAGAPGLAPRALVASFVLALGGDLLRGIGGDGLTVVAGFAWLFGYLLLAGAALHPSMRELEEPRDRSLVAPVGRWASYAVALAALPLTFFLQWLVHGRIHDAPLYVGVAFLLTALVVARLALLFDDVDGARLAAESSERKFRVIFESAPVGISLGRDGMMEETNPALQRMLGYSAEELGARHFLDVTHPLDHDLPAERALDSGAATSFDAEKRYLRRDGGVLRARVRVTVGLRDDLGLSIIEDVTERRALERQLREAQRLEAVANLAGGIAHDFNNLMTAVGGHAELLLRDADDGRVRRRAVAIRDAADRAADLTRQLLAFSRRQVLELRELDLRDAVASALDLIRPLLGDAVRLETSLPDDPVTVRADPRQLEHVLLSLAANACDAMPERGVRRHSVGSEADTAVLAVADTGHGMSDAVREQIFEPFFSTKGLAAATGLGLATVHGIVHQSGGSIDVVSKPGEGSAFTIRLPLALPGRAVAATL